MRRLLATALVAGLIAGAVVGMGDALAALGALGQFTPGVGGKLRTVLLTGALLGLGTGLVALAGALGGALLGRFTALGALVASARARHAEARARDPREALGRLALTLAALPALGGALGLAYKIGAVTIATRKHKGLIIAVTIAATVFAIVLAALVTFVLGALLQALLRRLPARARLALSHPAAPAIALGVLVVGGALVAYVVAGKALSLDQVALRPLVVGGLALVAVPVAWPLARRAVARLAGARPLVRKNALPAGVALLVAMIFVLGAAEGPRKAAAAFTGLSGPLMQGIRRVVDLDRDRFSPVLGGGDCDDWNARINPLALDLPDDGIDQNCSGADLKVIQAPVDQRFVPLPAGIPTDANVILITVDALRADHLGTYGYARPTSPTIDALAAEGTVFEHAWAHAPSTRYSIPAIITGRYPSQVRWDDSVWWPALQPENTTIAEVMKAAGLTTAAILNYHYFDRVRRMDQGFDSYDNENAKLHQGADPAATQGTSAKQQTDKAIAYVEQHQGQRFFLWMHYYDTHYQYERHAGTKLFGGSAMDLYDHEILFTDEQLARLVARLRALGLWDKTVIVLTGDHGEGFGEHTIDFHGYHLYRAQTQVPIIVRVPGARPARVALPAGHVDLLPTLANLVGQPATADMQGRSLLGEIVGAEGATPDGDRDIYQEVTFEGPTRRYAAATRRWHMLFNQTPDNTWELYDLIADPDETRDVMGVDGDDVAALRDRLAAWVDALALPPGAAEKLRDALLTARPSPTTTVTADWAGKVRLLGADLPTQAVKAGERVSIVYYLESLAPLDGDWTFFVHVEGPARFQDDHVPADGALPFARLSPGQLVADRRELTVPRHMPAGRYTIYVGLWRRMVGNLPVTGGATPDDKGRVAVGTLEVTR